MVAFLPKGPYGPSKTLQVDVILPFYLLSPKEILKWNFHKRNSYRGHQESNPELKEAVSLSASLLCSHQLHFEQQWELWREGPWNLVPRFSLTVQVLDWTLSPQTTHCIPYPFICFFFLSLSKWLLLLLSCSCLFLANFIQFQVDDYLL